MKKNIFNFRFQNSYCLFSFFIFSCIHLVALKSQSINPEFEIKFYFEDAKGNKDSVILGYDFKADSDSTNTNFGEDELLNPFDSIFDVRVAKSSTKWNSPTTGKKRIGHISPSNNNNCDLFGFMSILINAKYNPIKISYDAKLLNNPKNACLQNTILSKTSGVFLSELGWYKAKDWYCLASQDNLNIDMSKKDGPDKWNERKYLVQGSSILTPIKYLNFNNFLLGPCNYLAEEDLYQPQKINLYPNPAYNHIFFELKQIEGWRNEKMSFEIYNAHGQIVQKQQLLSTSEQYDIDISTLANGFYFAKITGKNKILYTSKFIKIE
jgi:hypothetical protein